MHENVGFVKLFLQRSECNFGYRMVHCKNIICLEHSQ